MSDVAHHDAVDDANILREQLTQIDQLPLEERAESFAQVHTQLQSALEGNDLRTLDPIGVREPHDG